MTAISSRGEGGRLTLAGTAGTMAAVCSIGLLATSAWLISRASQHPPVLYLMIPVAAVQAFGIGRGVFRYAERLGHDAACACWPGWMSAYDKLERARPGPGPVGLRARQRRGGQRARGGAALWGCLVLGVAGVRSGTMAGVTLAVLALMPLAVHEVFTGLAPAAQEIPRLRSAADRVADVLRHPDPVTEPVRGAAPGGPLRHHGAEPGRPLGGRPARRAARRPRPARRVPGRGDRAERRSPATCWPPPPGVPCC